MIIDGNSYKPKAEDILLFDTNVLIILFSPVHQGDNYGYDKIFELARESKSRILLTSIQVSEFFNRCIRTQFKLYCDERNANSMDFKKDYRITDDYLEAARDLISILKEEILPYFDCIDDGFAEMDLSDVLNVSKEYDFNDKILENIALKYHAKIVTSDYDFWSFAVENDVITTLPRLLDFGKMFKNRHT